MKSLSWLSSPLNSLSPSSMFLGLLSVFSKSPRRLYPPCTFFDDRIQNESICPPHLSFFVTVAFSNSPPRNLLQKHYSLFPSFFGYVAFLFPAKAGGMPGEEPSTDSFGPRACSLSPPRKLGRQEDLFRGTNNDPFIHELFSTFLCSLSPHVECPSTGTLAFFL